jgi:hypothetical protein
MKGGFSGVRPARSAGIFVRVALVMARKSTPEKIDLDVGDALERALSDNLKGDDIDLNLSIDDLETKSPLPARPSKGKSQRLIRR